MYLLGDSSASPTDGLLVSTREESFRYAGFHKVRLDSPVRVMRGQRYAVVVTQTVPSEGSKTSFAVGIKVTKGKAVINKGESMLYADGEWSDLSDTSIQEALLEHTGSTQGADVMDNFAIKGFAEEKPDVVLNVDFSGAITPVPDPDSGEESKAYFLSWIVDNTGSGSYSSTVPEWSVAPGGEEIITMTDGRDPSRKTVTCKKYGWTYITVSARDIGTAVVPIVPIFNGYSVEKMTAGKNSLRIVLSDTDQPGLGGYEVEISEKGKDKWTRYDAPAPEDTVTVTGLKAGARYDVRVRRYVVSYDGKERLRSEFADIETSPEVGLKNTLKASGKTVKVDHTKLSRGDQKLKRARAILVSGAKGRVTYAKVSGAKKITISKKTGKITLKKGLKKGKYTVRIRVKAAGDDLYKAGSKTVRVKVAVK